MGVAHSCAIVEARVKVLTVGACMPFTPFFCKHHNSLFTNRLCIQQLIIIVVTIIIIIVIIIIQ